MVSAVFETVVDAVVPYWMCRLCPLWMVLGLVLLHVLNVRLGYLPEG